MALTVQHTAAPPAKKRPVCMSVMAVLGKRPGACKFSTVVDAGFVLSRISPTELLAQETFRTKVMLHPMTACLQRSDAFTISFERSIGYSPELRKPYCDEQAEMDSLFLVPF